MTRDLKTLGGEPFDVLVIGGGAAGAAAAREASLRGLRTALIERDDFGGGTSAHCFKVVHGGIRYIQHADLRRLRLSCAERSALLRLAPHLVHPLPFVVPTYGHARSSKWFIGAGMLLYDALTLGRNRGHKDPSRRIRLTRFLGREETLRHFPLLQRKGLTGAAVFEDGQMHNPARLVLAFVIAAQELGATVANYVEAERFLLQGNRVIGVSARDRISGDRFDIRARLVINAAGPWAEGLLQNLESRQATKPGTYSRDACFVIARNVPSRMALAVPGASADADAVVARGTRHLFLVPWRDCTLVGVWHRVLPRDPDAVALDRDELQGFIDEINAAFPGLDLDEQEVRRTDFGLVPFGEAARQNTAALSFGKHSRLIDHRRTDGIEGLITSISVRYTVARRDAVNALNLAMRQLGSAGHVTDHSPLPGGDIEDFERFLRSAISRRPAWLSERSAESLARNFGTRMSRVLAIAESQPALRRCLPGTDVTLAEVAYALRSELAQHMTDIVFRRTELGTAGHPGEPALAELSNYMQQSLGWSTRRTHEERRDVDRQFTRYLAADVPLRRSA
jgi:glycerol-3-phosphate dehydrogenase